MVAHISNAFGLIDITRRHLYECPKSAVLERKGDIHIREAGFHILEVVIEMDNLAFV